MKKLLLFVAILCVFLVGAIGCSKKGKARYETFVAEQVSKKYLIEIKANIAFWSAAYGRIDDDYYYFYTNELPVSKGDTLIIKEAYLHGLNFPEIKLLLQKGLVSYKVIVK